MKNKQYRIEINLFNTGNKNSRREIVKYRKRKESAVKFARRVSRNGIEFVEDGVTMIYPDGRIASVFVSKI